MKPANPATARRDCAALALVATAVLSAVSNATAPEFPSGYVDRLAEIDAAGARAWVSSSAFVLAQLPFLVAVLGVGHLLRPAVPRSAFVGTCLAAAGAFGHAVFGGIALTTVAMAQDETSRETMAALLEDIESSPAMAFAAVGLLGTVLGLVVLSVGLWRTRVAPRWVPALVGAFIVVEFAGSAVTEWSFQVAAVLYLIAFVTLARVLHATPAEAWATAGEVQPAVEPSSSSSVSSSAVSTSDSPVAVSTYDVS